MPKIRFWSNSQPGRLQGLWGAWCLQYAKDTLLKQFTTLPYPHANIGRCLQYAKDTLLKQFTTEHLIGRLCCLMSSICQRYAFEAIHNVQSVRFVCVMMSSICQRYAFEAIHNFRLHFVFRELDVFNMPKIRFWSNSQRCFGRLNVLAGCLQYAKDTLLKQFTTNSRYIRFE